MEQESDDVFLGKLLHEHSYKRKRKEVMIDGVIKIDFIDNDSVHEIKKSNRMEQAHRWQLLYYLYSLRQKGVDIRKGVINYPRQRRTTEVELTSEIEQQISNIIEKIINIESREFPPDAMDSRICKKCSYEDFCYS